MNDTTLSDNVKDKKMNGTQTDNPETRKTKSYSSALIAALAIGTVVVLPAAIYSGYWWDSGKSGIGATRNEQTTSPGGSGEAAPVPADIEADAINLGE
jgi:hypothetical protein